MSKPLKKIKKKGTLDALSKISGLSKDSIRHIAEGVMENNKLLNSCTFHIFEQIDDPAMSRRFMCKNCRGIVGTREKMWYERGIKHSQPRKGEKYEVV